MSEPAGGMTSTPRGRSNTIGIVCAAAAAAAVACASSRAAGETFAIEIAPGVYVHQGRYELFSPANGGDISNCAFVVGSDAVAVIDSCGSAMLGTRLRTAVRAVTGKPIRYVINTHMHPDHVFGNTAFAGDKPDFVGHHKLARALAARAERYTTINKELLGLTAYAGTLIVPPTLSVEDRLSLDLGGRTLELEAQKTAHTDNDLVVRDTMTGTLFLGDLLFSEHVPVIDGSIRGWIALMERLAGEPAEKVVPGHGPASMPWPGALEPQRRYLDRVATDVRRLIKEGHTLSEAMAAAGQPEKDAWRLFDEYHGRNISAAFAELEWE